MKIDVALRMCFWSVLGRLLMIPGYVLAPFWRPFLINNQKGLQGSQREPKVRKKKELNIYATFDTDKKNKTYAKRLHDVKNDATIIDFPI